MDITSKKNRSELKAFFEKNKIPTQEQFASLIDGMINQQDDRVAKLPDEPLSLEALGDFHKIVNFYESFGDPPAWSLQLNPRADSNDPQTARPGFCIADGQNNSPRLFIDKATGNIGIGINNPIYSLEVSASRHIKLGLEGSGGGQLILSNNTNDNKIFLEAFSKDGTGHASELLLTGRNAQNVPKITLMADVTTITGGLVVNGTISNTTDAYKWKSVTAFLNGWNNYDDTFNHAAFRIDADGVVWLRGLIKGGGAPTNVFQLPSGYWPSSRQLHVVCTYLPINNIQAGRVDVDTSGYVSVQNGRSEWICLDGIAFRAAGYP